MAWGTNLETRRDNETD